MATWKNRCNISAVFLNGSHMQFVFSESEKKDLVIVSLTFVILIRMSCKLSMSSGMTCISIGVAEHSQSVANGVKRFQWELGANTNTHTVTSTNVDAFQH